jgi:hypothetical protein
MRADRGATHHEALLGQRLQVGQIVRLGGRDVDDTAQVFEVPDGHLADRMPESAMNPDMSSFLNTDSRQ